MKQFIAILCLLLFFVGNALAKDKCDHSEFKTWQELKESSILTFTEDDSAIKIETSCKIKFHKDFNFTTTKDLSIFAKKFEIKKESSLSAKRLLIVAEEEFKLKKKASLCAELVILETPKLKLEGEVCPAAQVLGSAVGQASAVAVLEVVVESETVPSKVYFDWSKSFGLFASASLDLGNGSQQISNELKLEYVYELAGSFNTQVRLQTTQGEILSNIVPITLYEPNPIADFGIWHIIQRGGTPPEVWLSPNLYPLVEAGVQIKEYRWKFGDNSQLVMPFNESPDGFVSHNYPAMGVYEVELEVVTLDGFSKKAALTIDLNNPSVPVPKYRVSSFKGSTPLTVTFTGEAYDQADETITYNWYFFDTGEQFFGQQFGEVTHTFTTEGVHYVYLETRDDLRGRRITYIPIYVGNVPGSNGVAPVAISDSTARFGEGPLTVNFSGIRSFDPSGNQVPLSFYWNFGDYRSGQLNQSFEANAVHTFNYPGSYFVNLVVTNSSGLQHSEFMLVSVDGTEVNDIDFEITPTGNLNEFAFNANGYFLETDYSIESPRWSFGDGTYQTYQPYVVHQYAANGTYDVELKIRRVDGDYDSYTRRLLVSDQMQEPSINILKQSDWFNLGESIQLSAQFLSGQSSDKTIYRWSMGDQAIIKGQGDAFKTIVHTYNAEESKNVRLTITSDNGLTATSEAYLSQNKFAPEINGLNIYGLESPAPTTLSFSPWETTVDYDGNFSHYIYEFGDNSPAITTSEGYLQHDYPSAGTFTVAVTAVDITGVATRFEREIIVKANQPPILSNFNLHYEPQGVAPLAVQAELWPHDDSDGYVVKFEVDWGDGSSQVKAFHQIDHFYYNAGNFLVRARVQDDKGAWSNWLEKNFTVNANQAPIITHVPIYGNVNEPAPVHLAFAPYEGVIDDQYIERWTYEWGDGSPLLETLDGYVEHDFLFAGNFNVVITAFDPYGLSSSYTIALEVKANQAPVLSDFDLHIPDEAAPVTVSAGPGPYASDSDGYPELFEYDWGDGTVEQVMEGSSEHIYLLGGEFQVSVRVKDDKGDWSIPVVKNASIRSNVPPTASIALLSQNIYAPTSLKFSAFEASDVDGVIENYLWALSDGRTFDGQEIEVDFPSVGQFSLNLQVIDNKGGIGTASYFFEVKQNDAPNVIINVAKTEISEFEVLEFDGSLSNDPNAGQKLNMEWRFSDGKILRGEKVYHFFENEGAHQAELIVTDESGLSSSSTQSILVTPLQVPPPQPIINISGAIGPNGGYRGEISFDAKESTTNADDEIIAYEWEFDDGMHFEGRYIARGFAEVGEHSATLTVKTALGLARSLTQTFIVEQINDPHLAYSQKPITLTSPNVLAFQPNNVHVQWTLEDGTFHPELGTNIFVNDEMLDRANLQLVAPNILEADVVLQDGKNIIQVFGFDNEEYQILQEQVIYSGSRSVAVTINDHNGNPAENQSGTIFLADNKEVKSEFVTDINGVAHLSNVPSVESFIVATAPNFYAAGSLQAETVSKVLTGIELNPALVSNDNMDFSNGLVGWEAELPVYEITPTEEGSKLSASITDGQRMKLRRVVKLDREGFVNLPFDLTANLATGSVTAVMTNTRTGEVANISQAIDPDNVPTISEQLFVHGELDDVIVLDLEVVMDGDGVSYISKLFDSYAVGGSVHLDTSGILLTDYVLTTMFAERSTDDLDNIVTEKLEYLSIIDFDSLKNGTAYDVDHFGHFDFVLSHSSKIESARVINIRVSQGDDIIDENYDGANAIYSTNCSGAICVRPKDPFSAPFTLDLMKGNRRLNSSQSVVFDATVEIKYEDGKIEYPPVKSQIITPSNFLFAHDWTFDERHYDEGGRDHFNLDKNFAPETDKGDFWSNVTTRNLLNLLMSRDSSLAVGDVSNINGGKFSPHGFHVRGNEFDAQTQYFKGGKVDPQKFSKKSIDEIDHLLSTPGIGNLFYNVLASDNKDASTFNQIHTEAIKNRCVQGRTLNNYIKFQAAHWHHWHFNGPRGMKTAGMPSEAERVLFDLDGFVEGQDPLTPIHPLYPDYEYIRFSTNSPELFERDSFRLRDVRKGVDLFESYEDSNFENNYIKIIKVSDGVVYKIKTENLSNITDPSQLPGYTLIAVAVAPGGRELCDKKEIPVFNIEKDCNKDGVEDDPGYKNLLGGVIGFGIEIPEGVLVQNDARICGKTTNIATETLTVDNAAVLDNVQIGNTCNSVLIDGDVRIIGNSKICTLPFRDMSKFGSVYIAGSNIRIDNSLLYGDISVGSGIDVIDTVIEGNSVRAANAYIYNAIISGHTFIDNNAFVFDSTIAASPKEIINTDHEGVFIDGAGISANSFVGGIGIVSGSLYNGQLSGAGSFLRADGYILMHLWSSGNIFNGGRAFGNGWIPGNIQDGGVGNFSGSLYFHSGVRGTIGAGGNANCYFYVEAGQLNKSICNQVYNGFRGPNVMNLNDWIAGKPWPDPL